MVRGHSSAALWTVWTRESVVKVCSEAVSTGPSELTRLRWAQLENRRERRPPSKRGTCSLHRRCRFENFSEESIVGGSLPGRGPGLTAQGSPAEARWPSSSRSTPTFSCSGSLTWSQVSHSRDLAWGGGGGPAHQQRQSWLPQAAARGPALTPEPVSGCVTCSADDLVSSQDEGALFPRRPARAGLRPAGPGPCQPAGGEQGPGPPGAAGEAGSGAEPEVSLGGQVGGVPGSGRGSAWDQGGGPRGWGRASQGRGWGSAGVLASLEAAMVSPVAGHGPSSAAGLCPPLLPYSPQSVLSCSSLAHRPFSRQVAYSSLLSVGSSCPYPGVWADLVGLEAGHLGPVLTVRPLPSSPANCPSPVHPGPPETA